MNQELEIEFKNLLMKNEFETIRNFFNLSESSFIVQENHYFDTEDFSLKENSSALRIRLKENNHILTLKQPQQVGLLETHQSLTSQSVKQLIEGKSVIDGKISELISEMGIQHELLKYFGTLKTYRSEVPYKNGILVLDHSLYLNVEDFELEYEVTDEIEGFENFKNLLTSLNIPQRKTENKIQRFYNKLYYHGDHK
ncbi:CYTH domain-containing protein [Litchfieldia alkalitelluris]|uniref:CYTH domain-containing protein n=1 Tax=Litchfieldia alkalitelluris TaxID=304268 RepID=UPI000998478C|nr:CYTH domain-containing protein [Litchfieldia alkalitelluris]